MRRFRRSGFSRKGPREPTAWLRSSSQAHAVNIRTAPTAITLMDPTSEVAGTVDELLTIRRVIIDPTFSLNVTSGAAFTVGDGVKVSLGVATVETGGALPDPGIVAALDERYDWMWLGSLTFALVNAATNVKGTERIQRAVQNQTGLIDLGRVSRKIHQAETLKLIASCTWGNTVQDLNVYTGVELSYQLTASVLYSRTMKRR